MRTIKTKYATRFLSERIAKSKFTQAQVAKHFAISESTLSLQLAGKASMPMDRLTELCRMLELSEADIHQVNALLSRGNQEHSRATRDTWLDLSHGTLDQIGNDELLFGILSRWQSLEVEQKVDILTMTSELAQKTWQARRDAGLPSGYLRAAESPTEYKVKPR